jgi:hypothetical protein
MPLDSVASRDIGKAAARTRIASSETPIRWPEVLGCLAEDETRSYALSRVRDAGFTADEFSSGDASRGAARARWRGAREAMADALTRTEDWLEMEHPRRERERHAIREVRRRLELDLWP